MAGIPARALGFGCSFGAFFLGLVVASLFVRKRMPVSASDSSEVSRVSQAISSKTIGMINSLFGMALGFGAFSLTDLAVQDPVDLLPPLVHFAFLCFLILVFWNRLFRVYSAISADDELVDFLVAWKAFFVVLAPPIFRLAVLPGTVTRQIGSTAFPIVIAMLALTSGLLYLHAGGFLRRAPVAASQTRKLFAGWAAGSFALAIIVPLSLLVPLTATLGPVSLRVIIWWIASLCFVAATSLSGRTGPAKHY